MENSSSPINTRYIENALKAIKLLHPMRPLKIE